MECSRREKQPKGGQKEPKQFKKVKNGDLQTTRCVKTVPKLPTAMGLNSTTSWLVKFGQVSSNIEDAEVIGIQRLGLKKRPFWVQHMAQAKNGQKWPKMA